MSAHPGPQRGVAGQVGQRAGELGVAVGQQPVDAVDHEVVDPGAARGDHGQAGGPRLERGDAERLEPGGGQVDVGRPGAAGAAPPCRPARAARPSPARGCAGSAPSAGAAGRRRRWSRAAAPPGRGGRGRARSTPSVARGRLRVTRRIADTTCTGCRAPTSARSVTGRHHAASTPLGTTSTAAPRAAADTRAAAIRDTALRATPRPAQRARWPTARNTPVERAMTQWKVAVTGSPAPRATGTSSVANGLTTPRCAWATSKPPAASRRPHLARGERVDRDAARQRDREAVHRDAVVAGRRWHPRVRRAGRWWR